MTAVLVVVFAALTSCAKPPPPLLVVGHAPATPTGRISTDLPLDRSGFARFENWPDACDLLPDQDIRSIFPQVTGQVTHQGKDVKLDVSEVVHGTYEQTRHTVRNGTCDIAFQVPPADEDPEYPHLATSLLDVSVSAVGEPDTLRHNVSELDHVAEGCTYRAGYTDYLCGRIEVTARIADLRAEEGTGDGIRFQVDGVVTELAGHEAQERFENDHVFPEIVKAVLAKLPTP